MAADVDYQDAVLWFAGKLGVDEPLTEAAEELSSSGQLNVKLMGPQLVSLGVRLRGVVR